MDNIRGRTIASPVGEILCLANSPCQLCLKDLHVVTDGSGADDDDNTVQCGDSGVMRDNTRYTFQDQYFYEDDDNDESAPHHNDVVSTYRQCSSGVVGEALGVQEPPIVLDYYVPVCPPQ